MTDGLQSVRPSGLESASGGASSQEADVAARDALRHVGPAQREGAGGAAVGRGALCASSKEPALPRWPDARAELPMLRAQLRRAERKRDVERERLIAAALARALVRRRCELDIAVRLARRAVLLGEDALRTELAAWHCQLGQTELGVGMLLPLLESPGLDRARLSMRIALYWARLGQAEPALSALREAAAYDPEDPLIHELQATVHGWAPHVASAAQAAEAYLRGAERRRARRDPVAAFQDVLRAFDTAPEHPGAAAALAAALHDKGQQRSGEEVWRRHADALIEHGQEVAGCRVHLRRLDVALEGGKYEAALAAALDARLDTVVDAKSLLAGLEPLHLGLDSSSFATAELGSAPPPPSGSTEPGVFERLLARLGLSELLAARLELAAEAAPGPLASRCYLQLGQLLERTIGSTERALEPWVQAVVADPASEAAREALRHYATTTGDYMPLVEALMRVAVRLEGRPRDPAPEAGAPSPAPAAELDCLRELAELARERLDDPALGLWCANVALRHEPQAEALRARRRALQEPAIAAERNLKGALQELERLEGELRVSVLRQAASWLRGRPDRTDEYRTVLLELVTRRPEEQRWRRLLETLAVRLGDRAGLSRLWTQDLVGGNEPGSSLRALLGLARLERQAGNLQGSLAVLAADDGRGLAPAAGMQVTLAAQLGNRRLRAEGLIKLGVSLPPSLRAWLASVASADLRLLDELPAALRAAEVATHVDPSATRPVVAYAQAAAGRRDPVAAVAYERAMALTFPSSAQCRGLVAALDALGDVHAAQVWAGRWLGLRPADSVAAHETLRTAARAGDATRLGDVVQWTVSQAQPLAGWAEPIAQALTRLVEADQARAARVAWKVLDAFGPQPALLKQAVEVVARQSGDAELEIAVLERELAMDGPGGNDALLWRLAEIHFERSEPDRACAVLVRALSVGLDAERVLSMLDSITETHTAEGEFHRLQAYAQAHERLGTAGEIGWRALRDYGAALWDLARDQMQAVEVWLRAAELRGAHGWFCFASDLVEVLGLEGALDEVCRLAESRAAPAHVAALLTGAAVVAQSRGGRRRALQLALLALDTEPGNVWALELIESTALEADLPSVESAYNVALGATLGSYGERALHYRAARFFERAPEHNLALRHAISAFRAVPSEGVTFALMLRLARGGKEAERAARAIEEVAVAQECGERRAQWLRRAALIAGRTQEGAQQRMEVLLRALLASPDPETVDLLGRAFTDLARQQVDGRALGLLRFGRAVTKLLPRLESIDGSRVALAMASVALSCFSDARLALQAIGGAVALDPEADEFAEFVPEAVRLAGEKEAAEAWLSAAEAGTSGGQRGSLGLLELIAEVALALGRYGLAAGFLVKRLELGPESEALQAKAEQAVRRSRQLTLPDHVVQRFPTLGQHALLLGRAERAAAEQNAAAELEALENAFQLDPDLGGDVLSRLLQLALGAGNLKLAEQVLRAVRGSELDREAVSEVTQALAAQLLEQREPARALALLREAGEQAPGDVALWTQALAAARAAGDEEQRQEILSRLIEASSDRAQQSSWLNEAWEVAKKRGQPELATEILKRWLGVDPEDTQALNRLEAECEVRQDWAQLVDLLGRHLALGVSVRERRRLVLWRSELLETRLGLIAEARRELSTLVEQAPGDRSVIERFAQLSEALGDHAGAAGAWLTASGLSSTRPVAAQLAERSCRLYLDAGDVLSARRVLATPQTVPRSLGLARLAVRLERDGQNEPRLARALEELAQVTDQPMRERASAQLEAANIWRRLGDDERACQCASEAARWIPEDTEAQILASYLEYRRRGPRGQAEARASVQRLRSVLPSASPDQLDLAAFLLAEALDLAEGAGAGLGELRAARERLGPTALIAVGLAERLARSAEPLAALEHFDVALAGGDLRGLRKPSQVALDAALVAQGCDRLGVAHRYAKLAAADPELAEPVARLRAELATAPSSMPPGLGLVGMNPSSLPPARRFLAARALPDQEEHDTRPARRTQQGLGRVHPGPLAQRPSPPPLAAAPLAAPAVPSAVSLASSLPRLPEFRAQGERELELYQELEGGSAEAGRELAQSLSSDPARVKDALAVLLALVRAKPGEPTALELLERTALAARDEPYATAVAHVRACSDATQADPAPALDVQLERVAELRGLLFSEADGHPPRALEVIWESTRRVLEWESVRDIKAAKRVRADDPSALAHAYFSVARLLGLTATPLLQLPLTGEVRASVIMMGEPSVLVRGECREDSPSLRYDLGAALAGCLPAYATINAATYEQIDDLFRAVHSAFGPAESSQTNFTSTARLSALLWESLPPRTQRQMTEWCREGRLTRELAVASARRAARRAGLFASGALGVALGRVIAEEGIDPALLEVPGGLARLCERSPAASDLVRLGCEPLYAHLRWRPNTPRAGQTPVTRRGL